MARSDYYRLSYLQTTGSQQIKTPFQSKAQHWVDLDVIFDMTTNDYKFIFGIWSALSIGTKNGYFVMGSGGSEWNVSSITATAGKQYKLIFGQRNTIVDGTYVWKNTPTNNSTGSDLYLFSNNYIWDSSYGYARGRILRCKLYDGAFNNPDSSILEADWIPAMRKSDSKVGMYDLVSDSFFVNIGSGEFEYGSIVDDVPNIFLEDNPLIINEIGDEVSLTANLERAASLRYKVNGVWKYAIPYIKLNGN